MKPLKHGLILLQVCTQWFIQIKLKVLCGWHIPSGCPPPLTPFGDFAGVFAALKS